MANRYFLPTLPPPGPHRVAGDLAHHLGRVLRVQLGDCLVLGDGDGRSALATVVAVGRTAVDLDVGPSVQGREALPRVVLAFALPRHTRADWLFEHGTEVGVACFQPLSTARTRPQGERIERWRKIVLAAASQCDRDRLPSVAPPRELAPWLSEPHLPRRRYVAEAKAPALAPADGGDDAVLLVGPEGGFTAEERTAILAAGFVPRGLGPHVLRTETAALVGAALLLARTDGAAPAS